MGFNNRPAEPLDFNSSPELPQADTSQGHDIPTAVSPTTAKLQDWIAWIRLNGVYFATGTQINSNITINGSLQVNLGLGVSGEIAAGSNVNIGGNLSVGGDVTSRLECSEMLGARGGFSVYRNDHGTLASNTSASDDDYLHSFDDASASVDVELQFDATTPGLIHCYCTSSSLSNDIEFRSSGILVATWPAGANRPYVVFVKGPLVAEPISHGGGTTFP